MQQYIPVTYSRTSSAAMSLPLRMEMMRSLTRHVEPVGGPGLVEADVAARPPPPPPALRRVQRLPRLHGSGIHQGACGSAAAAASAGAGTATPAGRHTRHKGLMWHRGRRPRRPRFGGCSVGHACGQSILDIKELMWHHGRRHRRPRFGGCSVCHACGQGTTCTFTATAESLQRRV